MRMLTRWPQSHAGKRFRYSGGGHVVILGVGASIVSTFRNSELNGKRLPSIDNFIEVVGLANIVQKIPQNLVVTNFEELYSNLYKDNPKSDEILEILDGSGGEASAIFMMGQLSELKRQF